MIVINQALVTDPMVFRATVYPFFNSPPDCSFSGEIIIESNRSWGKLDLHVHVTAVAEPNDASVELLVAGLRRASFLGAAWLKPSQSEFESPQLPEEAS